MLSRCCELQLSDSANSFSHKKSQTHKKKIILSLAWHTVTDTTSLGYYLQRLVWCLSNTSFGLSNGTALASPSTKDAAQPKSFHPHHLAIDPDPWHEKKALWMYRSQNAIGVCTNA